MFKFYEIVRKFKPELVSIEEVMSAINNDIRGFEPLKDNLDIRMEVKYFKDIVGERGRRLDEVLEVVEDEQQPLLGEEVPEALGEGYGAASP